MVSERSLLRSEVVLFASSKTLGSFNERYKTKFSKSVGDAIIWSQANYFKDEAIRKGEFAAMYLPMMRFEFRKNA